MKSGKSLQLIASMGPLQVAKVPHVLYTPLQDVRQSDVRTRYGIYLPSTVVEKIPEMKAAEHDVIGIDELHMFPEETADSILKLLLTGRRVIAAGLDKDYRGKMFPLVQRLLEFGPKELMFLNAVCDLCGSLYATHTMVSIDGKMVQQGLPSVIPEGSDSKLVYQAACLHCYQRRSLEF